MEEYNGKCRHRNYSGHLAQFFNVIIRGTFKSFAMQNPRRIFIFSRVFETRQTTDCLSIE